MKTYGLQCLANPNPSGQWTELDYESSELIQSIPYSGCRLKSPRSWECCDEYYFIVAIATVTRHRINQMELTRARPGGGAVIRPPHTPSYGFLPITFDRNDLETWGWCHSVRLVKAHRLICNMTYLAL